MNGLALDGLMLVFALFLVALNGLFVAAEFALVKIRATQVDRLVVEGKTSAGLVEDATDKLDAYLSVSQLGITISSLGLGWIGEPAFAHFLQPLLEPLGVPEGSIHVIAFAAAFGTITFLHVVFGELAPKSVAIARAEGTALFVAPFMRFFYYLFWPGIVVFNGTANAVVRLFGIPPASETEETHSEEELRIIDRAVDSPRRPEHRRGAHAWRGSSSWRTRERARSWFPGPTSLRSRPTRDSESWSWLPRATTLGTPSSRATRRSASSGWFTSRTS